MMVVIADHVPLQATPMRRTLSGCLSAKAAMLLVALKTMLYIVTTRPCQLPYVSTILAPLVITMTLRRLISLFQVFAGAERATL